MTRSVRNGLTAVVLVTALVGCGRSVSHDVELMNVKTVRGAHAALQRGDLEGFKATIGSGYVRHCQAMPPGLQEVTGADEFSAFIEEFLVAAPGYEDTLSQMIAQEDKVAYVSTMTGVQSGQLGDLPASGKPFKLVNIVIQRLANGKIVETWVSWDTVAFLTQLGLMPSVQPAGS